MNNLDEKIWHHKNFNMVQEVDISGEFIYNGITALNQSNFTRDTALLFSALYNIAVGIERIQKIILILAEEITINNYEDFEKQLITHSHTGLQARINKKISLDLNPRENELLQLLQNFYNTGRYNRFNLFSSYENESVAISEYTLKYADKNKIELAQDTIVLNDYVKDLFGKVVGSISKKYYAALEDLCSKANTFSYELRSGSKAQKVFLNEHNKNSLYSQKVDERIAFTEFLIYLANNKDFSPVMCYIKTLEPLEIEQAFIQGYIDELSKGNVPQDLIDEVEHHYEEREYSKNRIESVKVLSNTLACFDTWVLFECRDLLKEFVEKKVTCSNFIESFQKRFQKISNYIDYDDFDEINTFDELERLCDEYVSNSTVNEDAILSCVRILLEYLNSIYNY